MANRILIFGGKYATDRLTLWLYLVPSLWANLLYDYPRLGGSLFSWLTLSATAFAVSVLPLLVGKITFLRDPESKWFNWCLLLAYLTGSGLRALVLVVLGGALGIVPVDEWQYRLTTSPLHVLVWMSLISTFVTARRRHQVAMQVLKNRFDGLLQNSSELDEALVRDSRAATQRVTETLEPLISKIKSNLDGVHSALDLGRVRSELLDAIDLVVRPLAHELANLPNTVQQVNKDARKTKLHFASRPRLKELNGHQLVAIILSYSLLVPIVYEFGLGLFLEVAAPTLLLTWVGGWLINRLIGDRALPPLAGLATLVALYMVFAMVSVIAFGSRYADIPSNLNLMYPALVGLVVIVVGLLRISALSQQELERRFASENDKIEIQAAKIRQQLWVVRNRLATVLHGPIQASLQVAAIRLATATTLDAKLSKELQLTIDSAVAELGKPSKLDQDGIREVCDELIEVWRGVCTIRIELSDAVASRLAQSPDTAQAALEVLRESCSNAVKHGVSSEVKIRAAIEGDCLLLEIEGNGKAWHAGGSSGLGLRMFSEVALNWDVRTLGGSSVLRLTLPLI
jgi:signal transduction histidine kinase